MRIFLIFIGLVFFFSEAKAQTIVDTSKKIKILNIIFFQEIERVLILIFLLM